MYPTVYSYIYSVADPGFDLGGGVDFVNGRGVGLEKNH